MFVYVYDSFYVIIIIICIVLCILISFWIQLQLPHSFIVLGYVVSSIRNLVDEKR